MSTQPTSVARRQSLADLEVQAEELQSLIATLRESMLAPSAKKTAPTLNARELTALTGMNKDQLAYRISRGDLPQGTLVGNRREWQMAEAREVVRAVRSESMRPEGAWGVTVTVANFKGGVAKTTTAVTLAQGLAMRGQKVLFIDLDPQGSATTLWGLLPDAEVEADQTAALLFAGKEETLDYAVRPTYWPGIDLVAAAPLLFGAEFALPARQTSTKDFAFWSVLDFGIDGLRDKYDVIVIDTPPSLSYVTINALIAADGLLMPLPPNALDFASSAQFWDLFSDLTNELLRKRGQDKTFEFVDVLLSRVESNDAASSLVREWIVKGYAEKVLPVEIPKTSVTSTASSEFGTVFDLQRGSVNAKTFARARDAYGRMCELIEQQIRDVWALQIAK
jgi:chromosome partitioning protein